MKAGISTYDVWHIADIMPAFVFMNLNSITTHPCQLSLRNSDLMGRPGANTQESWFPVPTLATQCDYVLSKFFML
jgi:hypothetical protein